jgi:hypothetical protein
MSNNQRVERFYDCTICKYTYSTIDALEYHFRKEHTKNELIHYLKIEQLNRWKDCTCESSNDYHKIDCKMIGGYHPCM